MNVRERFKLERCEGDIGIEIEVEGNNLPDGDNLWRRDHDGSLRGDDNAEYVMKKPLSLDGAEQALVQLKKAFKGARFDDSVRAGTHIHINMQECTMKEVYTMYTAYLVVENALVELSGEGRQGNLFCLRADDAKYILHQMIRAVRDKRYRYLASDDIRYCALNVKPITSYGSLEYRALRSTDNFDTVMMFAKALHTMREQAKLVGNPVDIVTGFSDGECKDFLDRWVGVDMSKAIRGLRRHRELLTKGVRNAQLIAYCTDWTQVDKEKPRANNPFMKAVVKEEDLWF